MHLLFLALCCFLALGADEQSRFSGYREEIVFPERLNTTLHPLGQNKDGMSENHLDGSRSPGELLLYRFRVFGEELTLSLEKDPSFFSEGLTIQYVGRSKQAVDGLTKQGTYYTGTVNSDPESIAAVNYDGTSLLGVLQFRGTEYHIQPLEGGVLNTAGGAGAHVVRKKMPEKAAGPMCGVRSPTPDSMPALGSRPLADARESPRRAKVGVATCGVC